MRMLSDNQQHRVLRAYHRAVAFHFNRFGEQWPIVRSNCVMPDGTIIDTDAHDPNVVANWRIGPGGHPVIELV